MQVRSKSGRASASISAMAVAHYADFYDLKHVLILGRVTSGRGGPLILEGAQAVLAAEFPELAASRQYPTAR